MKPEFQIFDNFLSPQDFTNIKNEITALEFQWSFSPHVDHPEESPTPGQFVHTVYYGGVPASDFYNRLAPILEHKLDCCCLYRIKANLQPRLPEPFTYMYHSDLEYDFDFESAAHWTTAIFYINTNNGYTQFKNGETVDSIENRLITFPAVMKHRSVSQTDTQTRIVINFNYLKRKER